MPTEPSTEETTEPVVRPSRPVPAPLAQEDIDLYLAKLPEWREHQGKHVLIYGGKVQGFYRSRHDAQRDGFDRFGHVAFLVKQVDLDEEPRPLVGVIY